MNTKIWLLSHDDSQADEEKVESIPLTFDSEEHYFGSFVYPLLEETRSELATSIKVMDTAPFADILSSIECTRGENILYDVTVGPWENRVKDSRWETRIHFSFIAIQTNRIQERDVCCFVMNLATWRKIWNSSQRIADMAAL
ncbi:hypothetical protein Tco_0938240 [Tanacetum coccineum]|uniref:Uncharacterized protein n=1 Tax=Tanacetum coccineum TaxID=301880 RepID=A0ABQ5DGJ3_9ASTR